jgi:hypothetical protein
LEDWATRLAIAESCNCNSETVKMKVAPLMKWESSSEGQETVYNARYGTYTRPVGKRVPMFGNPNAFYYTCRNLRESGRKTGWALKALEFAGKMQLKIREGKDAAKLFHGFLAEVDQSKPEESKPKIKEQKCTAPLDHKLFDKELYDQCNPAAIEAAVSFLHSRGYTYQPEGEQYAKRDIKVINREGKLVTFELEQRLGWLESSKWAINTRRKDGTFEKEAVQWDTITVPGRKIKNESEGYIAINELKTMIAVTKVAIIKSSPTVRKSTNCPNGMQTENEKLFDVSRDQWMFFRNIDGIWIKTDENGSPVKE